MPRLLASLVLVLFFAQNAWAGSLLVAAGAGYKTKPYGAVGAGAAGLGISATMAFAL